MTAIEAIIYCIHYKHDVAEDGEYCSQVAYDVNGEPHWIAWKESHGKNAKPRFCSASPTPFIESLEPYRT